MTDLVFVDTNVVIYSRDRREPWKAEQAITWLKALRQSRRLVISPQILNETYAVSLWKFKDVERKTVGDWVRKLVPFCTAPVDADVFLDALALEQDYRLSWWDCVIVASALRAQCRYILSEDMQHSQLLRSLRVVNPFRQDPASLRGD